MSKNVTKISAMIDTIYTSGVSVLTVAVDSLMAVTII